MMARIAEAYARRGLRVLPIHRSTAGACTCGSSGCMSPGKHPISSLVPHGVTDASGDVATIREWWNRYPSANVAIAVPDGWRVLDVDPRNGGDRALAGLIATHGPLPSTVTARTGSGGSHHLYAFPRGNYRGKIGHGLDLLGPGKYFVVAPSVHPCGGIYAWVSQRGMPIAPAPAWLVALATVAVPAAVSPVPRSAEQSGDAFDRARKYLERCDPAISGSGGHTQTFMVAQKLVRGFGLSEGDAFALMTRWNVSNSPPWSVQDLVRKVKQAAQTGTMPMGALLDAPRRRAS